MKNLLTALLLIKLVMLVGIVKATNYYFSTSSGDDSRTAAQAQNPATPWKTLNKLNSFFSSLQPGDAVLFARGEIFYGSITINKSGSSGSPIVLGAYGSGAKPVITGLTTVNAWTNLGGNIWESTSAVSALATTNMVVENGINTPMGRYPNTGYLTFQSHSGTTSITSSSLSGTPNWTGAEVVIRKNHWILDRNLITSQSGGTISYTSTSSYPGIDGYGFFIQNDARTLDQQGEWYFNPSTQKIRIYSGGSPANVQVSTIETLVYMVQKDYITFDNLSFQGSNTETFYIGSCKNTTLQNCSIDFSGKNAIWGGNNWGSPSSNFKLENCIINHTNNNAITLSSEYSSPVIRSNTITNTAVIPGMSVSADRNGFVLISDKVDNMLAERNRIDSAGYVGIQFSGSNSIVQNNFITNFCLVKDDGAGIYAYDDQATGKKVLNNIVLNGIGAGTGTADGGNGANGIYIDDDGANVEIAGNTVSNCALTGLFLHNVTNINIHNNTFYNNNTTPAPLGGQLLATSDGGGFAITNVTLNNNIMFSKTADQYCATFSDVNNGISSFGAFDNNYYARPIDDNLVSHTFENRYSTENDRTLAGWKTFSGQDANSKKSPKSITTTNDLRFEYNETASNKVITLGATYIDVKGTSYPGTITLAPYTSAVLIYQSGIVANQPPVANAGADFNITLPTNSVTLIGSGTDADGTIASYQWTKVAGPASAIIVTPNLATTTVTTLVQGAYQFELKVTDNMGAIAKDTVTVNVNPATLPSNQPPIANAGSAQIIILPVSLAVLDGSSSTDADGNITSYQWTKVSGPALAVILTPNLATTTVTTLVQGTYQFELKVTDNLGAIGKDTVTVTVNSAINQSPVANAGSDKTITLPTNSVTLIGGGTDADGTVASYQWSKISGPSQFAIASATQSQTAINNLIQGVYQFELKVTDNLGAIGKDTVKVTVNATPNQQPVASAGLDKTITLPTNNVTLTGSGTDADGTIAIYQWTKISGPSQFTIASPNQVQTLIGNLVQGIYQFELRITDNLGAIGKDTVIVTVNAAPNQSPVANTGSDKTIALPTNNVTLTGSGIDADGTIAAYQWSKVSGPSQFTIATATQAQTAINNLIQGIYQFELKVTDNLGAIGKDTVIVTVNAAPSPINQLPVANAGTDNNITLPTNSATLTGSGTDADGTIATYRWTMVAGPAQFTIVSRNLAQTAINNMVQGIYKFELQVTDNLGGVGKDTVIVTVNAAPPPPNQPPIANTGIDKTITLPTNSVTLNGSGTDADGTVVSYLWTKVSGPAQFAVTSATQAQTAINNLVQGVYQFELKVTDNLGAVGKDTILVTVNASLPPPPSNQSPIANAGSDVNISLPTNSILVTGTGTDADGTIASYRWTKIAGPSQFKITSRSQAQTTITNLAQGVYQFELQVTDNQNAIGKDTISVTVNAAPAASNKKPVGNAGVDKKVTLPTNNVTLAGSGTDPDGTVISYQWTEVSGPLQSTIASPSQTQTEISNLAPGVYEFELKVTDDQGATGEDTVMVTVNSAPNQLPLANAGNNINITLPTNSVTLIGNGVDFDGTIVAYRWTSIAGPAQFTIASRNQSQTDINNLVQGIYQFELQVTDNLGAIGKDTVIITVNAAANQPPVAYAGIDNNITLPANSVTLIGAGIDVDGTIVSYQWSKVSGPAQFIIVSETQAQTIINNLVQGVYQFELKVTDNQGAVGRDIVIISVNAAPPPPNQPPAANAGPDKTITLPTNAVILTGSGTDPDGTIASYQWSKISGPAQFAIASGTQAQTIINNLVQGVYQFELTVTDNLGATGKDIVTVTVNSAAPSNQPPVANAGTDKNIILPTNSVSLTGSGTDADGTIASYQWSKVSGPVQFTIISPTQTQTSIGNLVEGVYQFELKVTDNLGATGKDTLTIIVYHALGHNQTPVANAGPDKSITFPANSVTLTGTGTDADGTITSYKWNKVSGPPQFTIASPNQGQTAINDLLEGVYHFELTVIDNKGGLGRDTVEIMVSNGNLKIAATIFPNPVATTLNVKLGAVTHSSMTGINIFDSRGVLLWQEQFMRSQQTMSRQIDVSKYPNGIYFIEVGDDLNREMLKFVKQ